MKRSTNLMRHPLFKIALAILSGVLLALGWPPATSFFLLFVGFVPLLLIRDLLGKSIHELVTYALLVALALLLWNGYTTQWIYKTYFVSGVAVSLINITIFTVPWILYFLSQNKLHRYQQYALLVSAWMSIELMHYYWGFAFPFLNLGNGLAAVPALAQWYEYTGVFGGSLWIWTVNLSFYSLLRALLNEGHRSVVIRRKIAVALACISIPVGCSFIIYNTYSNPRGKSVEVVAVHTDLECGTDRRQYGQDSLLSIYWNLSAQHVSSETGYVVWPETSLNLGWIEGLSANDQLRTLIDSLEKYPNTKVITGSILYEKLPPLSTNPSLPNASYLSDFDTWYNTYNAAVQIDASSSISIRTKVNLVPLEETTTYPVLIGFLRRFIPTIGDYRFSTRPINNDVFKGESVESSTLICYEVLFGNTVIKYPRAGADILFLILNEGWIDDDQQARQFLAYTSLRAIENRRSIVKASNKGITAFIDQKGIVSAAIGDPGSSVIVSEVQANRRKTLYTQWGDYLGWISVVVCAAQLTLLVISAGLPFRKKVLVHN